MKCCEKCGSTTTNRWDYYPTKKTYNNIGVLIEYETKPFIKKICENMKCRHLHNN